MGSEKYPVENEFDAFMSKHGGAENAFTESGTRLMSPIQTNTNNNLCLTLFNQRCQLPKSRRFYKKRQLTTSASHKNIWEELWIVFRSFSFHLSF